MASYSQRRGLQGVDSLRKKLRNMEKVIESGIRPAITQTAIAIEQSAKGFAPRDTGDLADSIEYKVSPDGMAAVVGPSAKAAAVAKAVRGSAFATRSTVKLSGISKKRLFQFFKGYWIEFGTKGAPDRNIPPMPARPFMQPAFDANKEAGALRVKSAVNEQLKAIASLT